MESFIGAEGGRNRRNGDLTVSLSARANQLYTQEVATRPPRKAAGKNVNSEKRRAAKAEAIIGPPLP